MAPSTGRQAGSRGKNKGDENSLEKYVTGNDKVWKKGIEKIIVEIEEMRKEMKDEMKEMRDEMERMKGQMMKERRAREEERRKEREEWKQERETLEKRIAELEEMNEKRERKERKNNIVIKGVKWREVERMDQSERIYKGEFESRCRSEEEIDNWEQKRIIMRKKKELEKGIIIEDDLTRKEREIQQKLGRMAKEEREKGDDKVKVSYMKISLKKKWFRWNERTGSLEEERRKRIEESRYNDSYKKVITEELPEYLRGRKRKKDRIMIARYRCGNEMKGNQHWMKEEDRKCRVCGKEIESIKHVLEECEGTRGEISEEEFLKENGKGCEVMKRIEEARRKKISERENMKETEE
ncbi:vicilin-like seed storage protein At2g18540 [Pseudomyrmex gracilis]|uniref:vicilin-like seed storage protein At2g18540 n=1 Tax=Pseudomyrmex gracilis TaxID=219809 RepID=UPI00099576CC|nr:vicilin-like seed storage protein At2g18540 [Pseudomyrmex gracilis]